MSAGGAVVMTRALFYLVKMVLQALFAGSKLMYIHMFVFGSISGGANTRQTCAQLPCIGATRSPSSIPPSRPAFLQRFGVGQMQPAASLALLFLSALCNGINI